MRWTTFDSDDWSANAQTAPECGTKNATGTAIGGVAGAVLTGRSTVGTVGGAAVGGVIGNQVDPQKK